ncbi:hypothetical protein [Streptomyces jumonjinensis]|uniref:hypothetical protein n=1 Tax=Streptomyces jumonjinensis TaxID=1945 RepID=UPI00379996E4
MRRTRRACRTFVRSLQLPPVAGIRDLVPELERRTGRSLQLQPAEIGLSAPCGMWIATRATDYVFYDPQTSRAHQDHIIAHEFGHMLKQHRGVPGYSANAEGLIQMMDPSVIELVLGRTDYDEIEEQEAELVGSYLQQHIHASRIRVKAQPGDLTADRVAKTFLRQGDRRDI